MQGASPTSNHPTGAGPEPQSGPRRRLDAVQDLRALAAVTVTLSHILGDIVYHGGPSLFGYYYVGAAGVDLFFVISGFVMVYAARDLFGAPGGPAIFLKRRLARIVPLYWVATGVYALVQIGQGKWGVVRPDLLLASLVFWPYSDAEGLHLPVYSIGWTLDCEMFFYLAFALGLPFRRRFGVPLVAGGLLGLVLLGTLVTLPQPLRFLANPILIDFLLGMGLGTLYLARWRLAPRLALAALLLAAALFAAATLAGFNAVPNVPDRFPRWIAWGVPAALLFAGAVLREGRAAAPRPALVLLGDASYALYLVHVLVIIWLRPLLPRMTALMPEHAALVGWLEFGLTAAAALALALAVHRGFERPVDRWLRRGRPARPRVPPPNSAEAR